MLCYLGVSPLYIIIAHVFYCHTSSGGAIAQLLEHTTLGEEVPGSIPAVVARYLLVGSVSV